MKKLRLSLDDISVDSFPTSSLVNRTGTVAGHGMSDTTCFQVICDCPTGSGHGCVTDEPSCNGTCDASCNGTCAASCNGGCGGETDDWSCRGSCAYDSMCLCTEFPQVVC